MAFFLARSAFCIGAVAMAASGIGFGPVADAVRDGPGAAAELSGRACLAAPACLGAARAAAAARVNSFGNPPPRPPTAQRDGPARLHLPGAVEAREPHGPHRWGGPV